MAGHTARVTVTLQGSRSFSKCTCIGKLTVWHIIKIYFMDFIQFGCEGAWTQSLFIWQCYGAGHFVTKIAKIYFKVPKMMELYGVAYGYLIGNSKLV